MTPTQAAVVKLGGSILGTRADGPPGVQRALLAELAHELVRCGPLVVVHGSGAFGKPAAVVHGYVDGLLPSDAAVIVSAVTRGLEELHAQVVAALREAGMAVFSSHAGHLFRRAGGRLTLHAPGPIAQMLARGLTPVLASGFVPDHDSGGFAIASSDAMACEIAIALQARSLVFATAAHGVYRHFPRTDEWHESLAADDTHAIALVPPAPDDVTGGMRAKLAQGFEAARRGIRTLVVDGRQPSNVSAALQGKRCTGTRLVATHPSGSTPMPTQTLEQDIDRLRLRIDERMRRTFDELVAAGPMAADPVVRQVYRWSHHYLESGGRRMHGVAVCLVYEALGGRDMEAALDVASAMQLYHHHTMVHDDVYDEDVSRRRWPTTHVAFAGWFAARQGAESGAPRRLFGNDAARRGAVSAIAYGKIMRALALHGIGTARFAPETTLAISNLLNWHDLFDCAGQMKDVDFEGTQLPGSQACLDNAWLKTGRLFELCARVGGLMAGASAEQQHAAALWAGNAGVAYQVQDDLEDIAPASEKGTGRGVGVDLLYCKPTYLYALARERARGADREALAQWEHGERTPDGVPAIIAIIERSGARRRVEEKVRELLDQGRDALAASGLATGAVAKMDRFARYFVSSDYWQRPLADGSPRLAALFASDAPAPDAPTYPQTHRDSARHGWPTHAATA